MERVGGDNFPRENDERIACSRANFMENHEPVLTEGEPFQRVNGAVREIQVQ